MDTDWTKQLADQMRAQEDGPYAYAIGVIRVLAKPGRDDPGLGARIREVLRALDLATADR